MKAQPISEATGCVVITIMFGGILIPIKYFRDFVMGPYFLWIYLSLCILSIIVFARIRSFEKKREEEEESTPISYFVISVYSLLLAVAVALYATGHVKEGRYLATPLFFVSVCAIYRAKNCFMVGLLQTRSRTVQSRYNQILK